MNFLGEDFKFWIAVALATLLKLMTSRDHSFWKSVFTVTAAVGSAWLFTDPVVHWMRWDPEIYKAPAAALVALTGEGVVRFFAQDSFLEAIQRFFKVDKKDG